ncbi:replication protein [Limosilactobacillus reuteri]|uniref:replication protein n=1 Tax=Limosilactobacillus reuteri TaxID=1598 RepID=UPI0015FA2687|nr:replication protein [Limosilactobacillus reuteri]MBB1071113.1 replication protein [Limosilactobacillus reuteri]MCC4510496.1 replication protein [Limosilactobacillus reuteri]MCC4512192.1 replication protein [Limosilactobacillus reuteri]
MTKKIKDKRSSKWAFLIYKESAPQNYQQVLERIHVPYMLSPWHDKDIDPKTKKLKKAHKHGVLYFDTLKSYSQVVELLKPLKGPKHIEIVHSTTGMYDYFVHADSPSKEPYDKKDIEYGCGFNISKFLDSQDPVGQINEVLSIIDDKNISEFNTLVNAIRGENTNLLELLASKTYFFSKYVDSRRYGKNILRGGK